MGGIRKRRFNISNRDTVTVNDVSGSTGEVDIAVSSGTLSPVSTFLKLSSAELVHDQKVTVPSTYQFNAGNFKAVKKMSLLK